MSNFYSFPLLYDLTKRIVFGRKLDKAVSNSISSIKSPSRVLIIGGGTGSFLKGIPEGVDVDYVDSSHRMITAAKQRSTKASVRFHCASVIELNLQTSTYDHVVLPFFLDLFSTEEIQTILKMVTSGLSINGKVHVIDFVPLENMSSFRKWLLSFTIRCFKNTTDLKIDRIADIDQQLISEGFQTIRELNRDNKLIFSNIYSMLKS